MQISTDPIDVVIEKIALSTGVWSKRNGRWYHHAWHFRGSGQKRCPILYTLEEALNWPEGWVMTRWWDYSRVPCGLRLSAERFSTLGVCDHRFSLEYTTKPDLDSLKRDAFRLRLACIEYDRERGLKESIDAHALRCS